MAYITPEGAFEVFRIIIANAIALMLRWLVYYLYKATVRCFRYFFADRAGDEQAAEPRIAFLPNQENVDDDNLPPGEPMASSQSSDMVVVLMEDIQALGEYGQGLLGTVAKKEKVD